MEDQNNSGNTESSNQKRTAPSSITVNVRPRVTFDEIDVKKNREIPKGLLVSLLAVGSLLLVGVIVVGVLLLTQPKAAAAVDTEPVATQSVTPEATPTARPEATPSGTPVPTPTATPVPTTSPEESDDLSAIFEAPSNPILEDESQNQ